MLLEQMTTNEVESALAECQSVIIPYGVLEAHGPHLPLATDTIQAYDAAKRAAEFSQADCDSRLPEILARYSRR